MSRRRSGYKPYEDTALCQAWLKVSTDASIGMYFEVSIKQHFLRANTKEFRASSYSRTLILLCNIYII